MEDCCDQMNNLQKTRGSVRTATKGSQRTVNCMGQRTLPTNADFAAKSQQSVCSTQRTTVTHATSPSQRMADSPKPRSVKAEVGIAKDRTRQTGLSLPGAALHVAPIND